MGRRKANLPDWAQREAAGLPAMHGRERLERAWNIGERLKASGDGDAHVEWLKQILQAAWKESRFDYKLRAFAELRRIHREDARYGDLGKDILWYYKWLVEELPEHADVPLATMATMFEEMESAYRDAGASLRPVYEFRSRTALMTGRPDEAKVWYDRWQAEPAGRSDDCAACEADRKIAYLVDRKEFKAAMAAAQPVLRGEVWCDDSPETLTRLIGVALRLDMGRLAEALLKASGRPVRQSRSMLAAMATQVVYHLLAGDPVRARRTAVVCLRRAAESINDADRYAAYRGCGMWAAMSLLAGISDRPVPARVVPAATATAAGVSLAEVAGLCLAEAGRIAAQFDARNGTSRYTAQLDELEQAIRRGVERGPVAPEPDRT